MQLRTLLGIVALSSGLLAAQGLHPKTGEWETTTTLNQGGAGAAPALPPGVLDRLPPDQRAKIEAQMTAAQGRTTTTSHCVTPEQSEKGFQPDNLPKSCSSTVITSSATQQKMTVTCDSDKTKSTGTIQVDVVSPDLVKGQIQMATIANGQTINMNMSFTSKWLGAACTENKSVK